MTEREHRGDARRVVAAVPDEQPFGVVEAAEEEGGIGDVCEGFGPVVQLRLEVFLGAPSAVAIVTCGPTEDWQ